MPLERTYAADDKILKERKLLDEIMEMNRRKWTTYKEPTRTIRKKQVEAYDAWKVMSPPERQRILGSKYRPSEIESFYAFVELIEKAKPKKDLPPRHPAATSESTEGIAMGTTRRRVFGRSRKTKRKTRRSIR